MNKRIREKGAHTWDLHLHYHECPKCGYLIESRDDFVYRLGDEVKDLECPRCAATFTVKRRGRQPIGPLFGKAEPPEMEWSDE